MSAILEAYAAGQRRFGENYVQELVEKASDPACELPYNLLRSAKVELRFAIYLGQRRLC